MSTRPNSTRVQSIRQLPIIWSTAINLSATLWKDLSFLLTRGHSPSGQLGGSGCPGWGIENIAPWLGGYGGLAPGKGLENIAPDVLVGLG